MENPIDRIIFVDKPANMTSFGAVARVRRILSAEAGKKVKVGHCGTLDPFATGLLILMAGKATKRAMEFTKFDKIYEATLRLGFISTTGDPEGAITERQDTDTVGTISLDQVKAHLQKFVGKISQTPPAFSAIKINGERAYKLARAGKAVEMPTRNVEIYSIDVLNYIPGELKIRCHVSSGTYIRTLAEDFGESLGCGAYLTQLRRTRIGQYDIADQKLFVLPE